MPDQHAKHFSRREAAAFFAALGLASITPSGHTQGAWPAKPIRIIVPFAAGVSPDVVARLISEPLARALGQPVVVDNRAGAAGIIGAEAAARSAPDGYTLFMTVNSIMGVNPNVYTKLPYDAVRDFTPVTQVALVPYVLVTSPVQPYKTLLDVFVQLRQKPASIDFGSLGVGSGPHVVMEMMNNMAGVHMTHIPYKGSPLTDVLAGQIPLAFEPTTTAIPLVKGGRLRALAITSASRNPSLPDVPTVAEFLPGYSGDGWQGFYLPAGTPKDIVSRFNTEIAKILRTPQLQNALRELGLQPVGNSVEQFAAISRSELEKWGRIARKNNIRVE